MEYFRESFKLLGLLAIFAVIYTALLVWLGRGNRVNQRIEGNDQKTKMHDLSMLTEGKLVDDMYEATDLELFDLAYAINDRMQLIVRVLYDRSCGPKMVTWRKNLPSKADDPPYQAYPRMAPLMSRHFENTSRQDMAALGGELTLLFHGVIRTFYYRAVDDSRGFGCLLPPWNDEGISCA